LLYRRRKIWHIIGWFLAQTISYLANIEPIAAKKKQQIIRSRKEALGKCGQGFIAKSVE
jgi:hypothetical protein